MLVITTPITADLLRGALDLERTERGVLPHRLPAWARRQYDDPQLEMVESQPSGVRWSSAPRDAIELDTRPTKRVYTGAPPRPDGVYDVLVDGQLVDQASGRAATCSPSTSRPEPPSTSPARPARSASTGCRRDEDVEIWLPHDETTELVALRTDAPIEPAADRAGGSGCTTAARSATAQRDQPDRHLGRPRRRAAGVELINLGFGGSALLQPFVARTMRDTPADLISVKLGINMVNTD